MAYRRWWRFSLRALLVSMLLFAIACGLVGIELAEMRREQVAIRQLRGLGFEIYSYAETADAQQFGFDRLTKDGPPLTWREKSIRWLFGQPFHPRVYSLMRWIPLEDEEEDSTQAAVDLRLLRDFELLEELTLSGATVRNVNVLSRLTRLRQVDLAGTNIQATSWLSHLTDLWSLDLSDSAIRQLPDLRHCDSLTDVNLARTQVRDLTSLQGCHSLQNLWLAKTKVTDLTPLSHQRLMYLDVSDTGVTSLKALVGSGSGLDLSLVAAGCQIRSVPPLKRLTYLDIRRTPIDSLCFARDLKRLRTIIISETNIADLRAIAGLKLESLGLGKTKIRDLSPLKRLRSLTTLWVYPGIVPQKELDALKAALPELEIIEDSEDVEWDPSRVRGFVNMLEPLVG